MVALLIFGSLSVGTLAAFDEDASSYGVNAESKADTVIADVKTNVDDDSAVKAEATEVNFFERLYDAVTDYISEILCVLAFGGSFLIAVLYKKGLLPIVKGSLLSIGNAVSKVKDSVGESAEKGVKLGESIEKGLENTKTVLDGLVKKISELDTALEERLSDESERAHEAEVLRLVLLSQIEMLRDIFMSAALPQYQKDAVGERIAKMKGALEENGERN